MKRPSFRGAGSETYSTEVLSRRWLSDITYEIVLTRPPSFEFEPGQRILLIQGAIERDYSLISNPSDPNLGLCIRRVTEGVLSDLLAVTDVGSRLSFTGPHGYFTFRPSRRPAVFVATGTGVAPFVSMVRSGVTGFTLLHGVRRPSDLYYESLLRPAAERYVPCLSGVSSGSPGPVDSFRGRVTDYIEQGLPPGLFDFYLGGRGEMVRDVTLLVDDLFPGSLVYTEVFF